MKILILLTILSSSAFGFVDPMDDIPDLTFPANGPDNKMNEKIIEAYCIGNNGSAPDNLTEFKYTDEVKCKEGRTPLFFYEAIFAKKPSINSLKMSDLDNISDEEKQMYSFSVAIDIIKGPDCTIEDPAQTEGKILRTCPNKNNGEAEDIKKLVLAKMLETEFEDVVASQIYDKGEKWYKDIHGEDKKPEVHINIPDPNKTETVVIDPLPETTTVVVKNDDKDPITPNKKIDDKTEPKPITTIKDLKDDETTDVVEPKSDPDCNEELNKEIAALLENDEKNIIGLQYELTVLKMAALATESKTNSIEGVIRQQSKKIDAIDDGIINKMNVMYKKHGLPEDAAAISSHLKQKSSSANYFAKDKRFFNQDSSAFLLAYQGMNEDSGIKDSDVSVLWFMDKVSEKAKSQSGKFSAAHNLTNLSTRLAQYTSAIDPKQALSKPVLDEMVRKQNGKIEDEFLQLIQNFKTSNPACYASLFSDSDEDTKCNLNLVEEGFSQLLAVNARIKSTDLISIDSKFVGGIENARFSLKKYVDAPEKVKEVRAPATISTAPSPEHRIEAKETAPKADQSEPVKKEEPPSTPDQFKTLNFTEE